MSYVCYCGHAHDEHARDEGPCDMDGCMCVAYEDDPEAE